MTKKSISIAIATYNGEMYLSQLLDSLFEQTVKATEIVVVDDCSCDKTVEILNSYSQKLPLKIFVNKSNLGVNLNFEKAVSLCSGDFILLCDQDDFWLPNNIKCKVKALESFPEEQPSFIATRSIMVDADLKPLISFGTRNIEENAFNIWLTPFQGTTLAFNKNFKNALGKWPSSFKEFPYDVFLRGNAVIFANVLALPQPLMLYRCHANNVELKINKRLATLKNSKLTLFLQKKITPKRLERLALVLNNIPSEYKNTQNFHIFNKLTRCLSHGKISWWAFFKMKEIPLKTKIIIIFSTALNLLKSFI